MGNREYFGGLMILNIQQQMELVHIVTDVQIGLTSSTD